ncbi:SDR family oxidoreductase [Micromonospora sp. WMMD1128]|uniref:SDR family oxidoreductase n=1 Tax=unclassified Micromonospora TaxID=2617518 RepID=UPI00248B3BC4|nr:MULTISPECIES: SDR family oxidoreductase [unclassified Micromonospora]WBB76461.1 SDR family oxidoreductase [Micromonospora sp. WMMD1128]WFE35755.1 SDR family oxidoreductase [Micromonospora sp. WMMD975]
MSEDQYTRQDPTEQYGQQPGRSAQRQSTPGTEQEMGSKPDHGEESYRGADRLSGKRAVITGGDSGIGRAVAIAFAREGADVLVSYLGEEEEADARETVDLVEQAGRRGLAVRTDLREEANCRELIDRAVADLGGIDVLVNNAAYQMSQDNGIDDISTEQFDRVFKTNVYAMFWLSRFAVPHLKEGSAIINTSSIQAFDPSPQLLDYATTKAAIATFTKALALNLADRGIRVNAVAPGPVWTPLIPATMPAEKVEQFGTDVPLGRPGQPAELAPAYVFFASQESSYVTGEILGVTGGRLTK